MVETNTKKSGKLLRKSFIRVLNNNSVLTCHVSANHEKSKYLKISNAKMSFFYK